MLKPKAVAALLRSASKVLAKPANVHCEIMILLPGGDLGETDQEFHVMPRIGELVTIEVKSVSMGMFEVIGVRHPANCGLPILMVRPIAT
jgi:hypothetical protein